MLQSVWVWGLRPAPHRFEALPLLNVRLWRWEAAWASLPGGLVALAGSPVCEVGTWRLRSVLRVCVKEGMFTPGEHSLAWKKVFGACHEITVRLRHRILVFSVHLTYVLDSGALFSTRTYLGFFFPPFYSFLCTGFIVPHVWPSANDLLISLIHRMGHMGKLRRQFGPKRPDYVGSALSAACGGSWGSQPVRN